MTSNTAGRKIKVGLIIDEFFGGAGTPYGGYGFLARKYVAKYIPNEQIEVEVLLGRGKKNFSAQRYEEDGCTLYRLPRWSFFAKRWLKKQNYSVYLSIELTSTYALKNEPDPSKRLILWIQDPRPESAWCIVNTLQSLKCPFFFNPKIYNFVEKLNAQKRVAFISQGRSLNPLGIELYHLPKETPVRFLPNPVDIDWEFQFDLAKKKKAVVFLGRLEAQKRCWLFCEVAKRMPEYDFYVLGQFFRNPEDNRRMLAPYMKGDLSNLPNLHFVGHDDGEKKKQLLKDSRVMLSTAIWEGIPISWLEGLSYGATLVTCLEREGLAERFGEFVGEINGDGFEGVDRFIPAIRRMMEDDEFYSQKARAAVDYIRETHSIPRFIKDLREVITASC